MPGTVDTTGSYNHYSALRSYEDLLGMTKGGTDGNGHLGFAAASGLTPFGQDVFQPASGPTVTTNPTSQSTTSGNTLTFTAGANIVTPSVQWQLSSNGGATWSNVPGATNASLTTGPLATAYSGWQVRAVFTNHAGSATTTAATITVTNPVPSTSVTLPVGGSTLAGTQLLDAVAAPGVSQVIYEISGNGLTNSVVATATPTIYGWLANWNTTSVANGSYTLESVASYSGGGTGTSSPVTVTITNPAPTTTVVLPSGGSTLKGNQLLGAVATPGVSQVTFEITGNGLTNSVVGTATPTIYGWLANWNTTTTPDGTYSLESVAAYSGGVSGSSPPVTVTISN